MRNSLGFHQFTRPLALRGSYTGGTITSGAMDLDAAGAQPGDFVIVCGQVINGAGIATWQAPTGWNKDWEGIIGPPGTIFFIASKRITALEGTVTFYNATYTGLAVFFSGTTTVSTIQGLDSVATGNDPSHRTSSPAGARPKIYCGFAMASSVMVAGDLTLTTTGGSNLAQGSVVSATGSPTSTCVFKYRIVPTTEALQDFETDMGDQGVNGLAAGYYNVT